MKLKVFFVLAGAAVLAGALFTTSVATFSKVIVPTANITTPVPKVSLAAPDTKTLARLTLPSDLVVYLNGPIGGNVQEVIDDLKAKAKRHQELFLLINSPGGSVLDGALLISAMEGSPARINTVCMQLCASMAFMVLEFGDKRMALDRALLMAHDAAGGFQGPLNQIHSRLNMITKYVDKMDAYVATRAGLSLDVFKGMFASELWLDSQEAIQGKFLDEIVDIYTDAVPTLHIMAPEESKHSLKDKVNLVW